MQAGYRTKPSARAKELKARIKNSKLDNAVYGSDFKAEAELNAISDGPDSVKVVQPTPPSNTSSGVSGVLKKTPDQVSPVGVDLTNLVYPSRSPSEVGGSPVSNSSTSSLRPIAPASDTSSTIRATTTNRANMFYLDEIRDRLAQGKFGLKPVSTQITKSDGGQKTQVGSLAKMAAEFNSIKGNSDSIKPSTVKTATKTAVNAPNTQSQVQTDTVAASTAPAAAPIDSKSGLKATKSNLAEVITKKDSNLSQTTTDPNSSTGSLPINNKPAGYTIDMSPRHDPELQKLSNQLMDQVRAYNTEQGRNQEQKTQMISLYKRVENESEQYQKTDARAIMAKTADNKWKFNIAVVRERNGKSRTETSTEIDNQQQFDLRASVAEAIDSIVSKKPTLAYSSKGNLTGVGLESASARVVWKTNRPNKSDGTYDRYVMMPAFMNGHVRLYGTGKKRAPLISQNNASPQFLRIVKDIVNDGTFSAQDYNTVDTKEATTVNHFIRSTKPIIPSGVEFNASHAGDVYELRKRYQVLVGALSAGNHGAAVKDEMIDILRKLQRLKVMSVARVNNLIKGLKEL